MSNSVGDSIKAGNANWSFGGEVAQTFDSHVSRSVPLYTQGHNLVAQLSDFFIQEGSVAYELGCSTAELTRKLAERNAEKDARFIGLDTEEGMIKKGKEKCKHINSVNLEAVDILDYDFEPADLIVSYYTIQFIKPKFRQFLFDKIYNSLNWGGAFILFEKVRASDARFQDISTALYTDFKLQQGFTKEEILGKSLSLKGVLEPFSSQANIDFMRRAGFEDIMTISKYVCFEGFLAIK